MRGKEKVVSASTGCDYDYTDLAECVERVHGEVQPLAPGGELLLQGEEPRHTVQPRHCHPQLAVMFCWSLSTDCFHVPSVPCSHSP